MSHPHPNLGSFVRFANATERRRTTVLSRLQQENESEYSPMKDHWKQMRDAVRRDRRTTRDGAEVRKAAEVAADRKRPSYERVAAHWTDVIDQWADSRYVPPLTADADVFGLSVHVVPAFFERRPDASHDVVLTYFNAERLAESTVNDVLRVVSFAVQGSSFVPTLVDLGRGGVHREITEPLDDIDDRLSRLAESFQRNWAA
ncbi:hypothetical protein [Microbacterium aurantiacum]|uniref:Uncharacterized protein n=1 Tax=Microbacterium aurantiacum TaxID=162393 RepID=A0ABT8FX26_9MICO|nr:hypothetical protein [Microbacterium aurantiacum]MDN4465730.1 hypothetical protein [Microbacterium aurantiacum]